MIYGVVKIKLSLIKGSYTMQVNNLSIRNRFIFWNLFAFILLRKFLLRLVNAKKV